ncbi:MAG: DoxX family protein [bacterium]|nr:DoxX family protein [bacterium]
MMSIDTKFPTRNWGLHLLRLGMAAVFLWFGFSQLFDGLRWVAYVPQWASDLLHLPPAMLVLGNGAFEVVMGTLIATNILVRIPALILGLHLIPIALDFGMTATGVRDFGLIIASFSLALIYRADEDKQL